MEVISICEWLRWYDEFVKIQYYYDIEGHPVGGEICYVDCLKLH